MTESNPGAPDGKSRGLLDIGIELSKQDVTAGIGFALYVLVKNPFGEPVWIDNVDVSLPQELTLYDPAAVARDELLSRRRHFFKRERSPTPEEQAKLQLAINSISEELRKLDSDADSTEEDRTVVNERIAQLRSELRDLVERSHAISRSLGITVLRIQTGPESNVRGLKLPESIDAYIEIGARSDIRSLTVGSDERTRTIRLSGPLSKDGPLQPGDTAVIRQYYIRSTYLILASPVQAVFQCKVSSR